MMLSLNTKVNVKIEGYERKVVYADLHIEQQLLQHHEFQFLWELEDVLGNSKFQLQIAEQYIGKEVSISLGDNNIFKGIITQICVAENNQGNPGFLISGQSPTILLEDGAKASSYYKQSLKQIGGKVLSGIPQNVLKTKLEPQTSDSLFYTVQYNETDFEFLQRLATRYGEWLYYDGSTMVFGKPQSSDVTLTNGVDLYGFRLSANIRPLKFSYVSYDPYKGQPIDDKTGRVSASGNHHFMKLATEGANRVFARNPERQMHVSHMHVKPAMSRAKEIEKEAALASLVTFEGSSNNPALKVGSTVKVRSTGGDSSEYIVTAVNHVSGVFGQYENSFTAIPASAKMPAYANPHSIPQCETQSGIVKSNDDPDGLGRVKVQFPWQQGSEVTPWLRVLTPHAGSGKGFHFIPEKDEEVLVAFEGGNAEKPYVLGSMYHGAAKSGQGGASNDIKALVTRSGNTLMLNDKDGSITITDPKGSKVLLKGDGTLEIDAPDKIVMKSKTIEINADNNIVIDAKSQGITVTASQDVKLESKSAGITVDAKTQFTAEGKTQACVKGATLNLEGTAMAQLQALLVKLN